MHRQILLAEALPQWEKFTPHAVAACAVATARARGSEAKSSVLSLYVYGKIKEPHCRQRWPPVIEKKAARHS